MAENTYLGVGKLIPSDMTCAMERENADTNEYVFTVTYKSDNVYVQETISLSVQHWHIMYMHSIHYLLM